MSFEPGAGFRICGYVVRRFVPQSGKCAFLTLDVPNGRGKNAKIELRTFEHDLIVEVGALGDGQTVQVTGGIDMEALKDKARNDVKVDGRAVWKPALTIKAIKIEASSVKPKLATDWNDAPISGPPAAQTEQERLAVDSDDRLPEGW